ncbi:MAG TPA: OmpH family outer membrane protein [Sphingobium sp.]|nr:OmpH family outer membrane protein [Sphingobium sp.]
MAISFKTIALGMAPLAVAAVMTGPAQAQSKLGVAVVNVDQAVAESNAYSVARTQMETTYKAQISQFNTRKTAIEGDLKAKRDALEAGLKANGGKPSPALQTQYEALQKSSQDAQAELQRIGAPIALAQQYIEEQIGAKLSDALKAAMAAAKVDLVLKPEATVSYQPTVDITPFVKQQLNTLVPSVSIVPPAGWRPGGQQAAAPAAPQAPAAKPSGR